MIVSCSALNMKKIAVHAGVCGMLSVRPAGSIICGYRTTVLWDMTPRSVVGGYRRFGGTFYLHLAEKIGAVGKHVINCTTSHSKNIPLFTAI